MSSRSGGEWPGYRWPVRGECGTASRAGRARARIRTSDLYGRWAWGGGRNVDGGHRYARVGRPFRKYPRPSTRTAYQGRRCTHRIACSGYGPAGSGELPRGVLSFPRILASTELPRRAPGRSRGGLGFLAIRVQHIGALGAKPVKSTGVLAGDSHRDELGFRGPAVFASLAAHMPKIHHRCNDVNTISNQYQAGFVDCARGRNAGGYSPTPGRPARPRALVGAINFSGEHNASTND